MTERILEIISHQPEGISPGTIISSSSSGESFAGKSVYVILNRLTREGRIKKENGLYSLSSPLKPSFVAIPGKADCELFTGLKRDLPFSRLCIWHTDSLIPLMHDIPNIKMTLVGAEKRCRVRCDGQIGEYDRPPDLSRFRRGHPFPSRAGTGPCRGVKAHQPVPDSQCRRCYLPEYRENTCGHTVRQCASRNDRLGILCHLRHGIRPLFHWPESAVAICWQEEQEGRS